jgi:hypothetical protein
MPSINNINSNFRQIAIADASDNVTGISVASPAGLVVGGGTNGQVLSTNGSGTLSWATAGGVTATNGRTVMANGFTAITAAANSLATGVQIIVATLPTIGTYDISYSVQYQTTGVLTAMAGLWNNSAGAAVTNSEITVTTQVAGTQLFGTATNRTLITTTATNTVIALRGWVDGGLASWNVHGGTAGMNGKTSMTWVRIA